MGRGTIGNASNGITSREYNPACDLCPKLCNNTMHVCMEGDGPDTADLMIIGEATGETEDEYNRPFIGRAGEYLREELLVDARVPESKVRFTNAVRCHPPDNRTPTILEIKKCRAYLEAEIRRVKPKVIVGMGNVPLASLLKFFYKGKGEEGSAKKQESKVSGISKWRGKQIWLSEFGCWFVPTFHPSYALRNEMGYHPSLYSRHQIAEDLSTAWALAQEPLIEVKYPQSMYVTSVSEAHRVLEEMRNAGTYAFDIETGGVGRSIDKWVVGCSFACSSDIGYYIPTSVLESSPELEKKYKLLLADKSLTKVMHNGAYEARIYRTSRVSKTGFSERYFDTMLSAHLLDENFGKGLKDLAWLYTPFGGYDTPLEVYKRENKIVEDYSKIPDDILGPYAALDAVATWILYEKLSDKLESEGLDSLYRKIVMPVRRVMTDAEVNGLTVDLERAHYIDELCTKARGRLREKVFEIAGREFNINSNDQLSDMLYNTLGFTPLKKTKKGYSVDKESIEYIAKQPDSDIAMYLLDRSYVSTMQGTHVKQAIEFRWPEDGKVHTHYNSTGTVTGRISASAPSLQNVPQDALVRSLYVASPGNDLVEADLKQAELATIAAISGEETFVRAFNEGIDAHSATYRKVFDKPSDYEPTKLERRMAKTINFGLVYGISAVGLANRLDLSVEAAQEFMDLYFKQLPNIAAWMEEQKRLIHENGYVTSVFGRKRRLPDGMSDNWADMGRAERQAMNAPIQSGAADYTYVGLIRVKRGIQERKLRGKIVHTVHDCVVTDTPHVEVEAMSETIKEAFETPIKVIPVRMKVDVEVNKRWGQENESRLRDILDRVNLKVA